MLNPIVTNEDTNMSYKDYSIRSSSLESFGKSNILLTGDKFAFRTEAGDPSILEQGGDVPNNGKLLQSESA